MYTFRPVDLHTTNLLRYIYQPIHIIYNPYLFWGSKRPWASVIFQLFYRCVIIHIEILPTAVRCPPLEAPENGRMNCSDDEPVYNTQCSFTCNQDHTLDGHEQLTCDRHGIWNGETPMCQGKATQKEQIRNKLKRKTTVKYKFLYHKINIWPCFCSSKSYCDGLLLGSRGHPVVIRSLSGHVDPETNEEEGKQVWAEQVRRAFIPLKWYI